MKKAILTAFVIAVTIITSCKKQSSYRQVNTGIYTGQFSKLYTGNAVLSYTAPLSGDITIKLNNTDYSSTSPLQQVVAAAAGKFYTEENIMTFQDSTIHPSNFDSNIILSGEYTFVVKGDSLLLTKRVDLNVYIYKMKKVKQAD